MKVIKDNSKKRITCTNCESILEYDTNDIHSERTMNGRQYVICPICDTQLDIRQKNNSKKSKDKSKKVKNDDLYFKQLNYALSQKFPSTLKMGCPICIHDLHRSLIDCNIYECFNCGCKIDFGKGTINSGEGRKCK